MKVTTAWSFYDFANSAYALLITGVGFQLYFKRVIAPHSAQYADFWWAVAVAGSIIASAIVSPILGAVADGAGLHKKFFIGTTLAAVFFTCGLSIPGAYNLALGVGIFLVANFFYSLALFLYDSYLKFVTTEDKSGEVSGFGWGLGYLGGILCLAITLPLFAHEPSPTHTGAFRLGFIIVGVFYFVFSLPSFKKLPVLPPRRTTKSAVSIFSESFHEIRQTLIHWRDHREVFKFLIAYYFISEAIMTAIYFMANYLSTTFEMPAKKILILTLIVQFIAFPATWIAGRWGDKWDIKKALLISTAVWMIIVIMIALGRNWTVLYVIAGLMGLVIGSTQALARTMLSNLTPAEKVNELFGFNSLSSKVAATTGPLIFGAASSLSGNQRLGWFSLLPFLVIGGWLTLTIRGTTAPVPRYQIQGRSS